MSNVNQTGRCFRVFLSASPALSDPSRQRGPCQLQQVMLARAAIRNSLPHLAMTTPPLVVSTSLWPSPFRKVGMASLPTK